MTGRIGVNPGCPYCDPLAAAGHRAGVWMWSILRHAGPVILEHALLPVKPGEEAAFESASAEAKAIIAGMPGFLRLTLSRCLERPNTYLLLVEWDRLVDHTEGFRGSPQYQEWRRLLHSFYEPSPIVEHYEQVHSA
jgi:heme-degrading monooxygenase HmoA